MKVYFIAVKNIRLKGLTENALLPKDKEKVFSAKKYYDLFVRYFADLVSESAREAYFTKEMTESIVRMILLLILRVLNEERICDAKYVKTNRSYEKAKNFIDQRYTEITSLDKICAQLHISKYYLSHIFKEYCGTSPLQYAISKKMELAAKLLKNSNLMVREVAMKCGYEDTNYFCKVFKSATKQTPTQYREAK